MKWPPNYTVRRSRRAQSVQLQFRPERGLELVLPIAAAAIDIPSFLLKHKKWIEKQQQQQQQQQQQTQLDQVLPIDLHQFPPQRLNLAAIWHDFTLYRQVSAAPLRLQEVDQQLLISGHCVNDEALVQLLKKWLQRKGREILMPWLHSLSLRCNLRYGEVQVRGQKSCWGSCSSQKNISLNYKLLFLPPELVDYVLLHELCHTIHLDHSASFWQLLTRFDPKAKAHQQACQQQQILVPPWLDEIAALPRVFY